MVKCLPYGSLSVFLCVWTLMLAAPVLPAADEDKNLQPVAAKTLEKSRAWLGFVAAGCGNRLAAVEVEMPSSVARNSTTRSCRDNCGRLRRIPTRDRSAAAFPPRRRRV